MKSLFAAILVATSLATFSSARSVAPLAPLFPYTASISPWKLEVLFGTGTIQSIFNGDAGRGEWQKAVLAQSWVSKSSPTVIGFDLPEPKHQATTHVSPQKDWDAITVLTDPKDPRFPAPGSVDLLNLTFMYMQGPWIKRLALYQSLVRPGGYAVIAHTNHYKLHGDKSGTEAALAEHFTEDDGWKLLAAYYANEKPDDYPTSEWWSLSAKDGFENFLLVYQKTSPAVR